MATYAVDFETFYSADYSVVDLGNWGYTHHPEFDAYLVSIVGDDGNSFVGNPKDFDWESIGGHVWVSHNATFDSAVYERLQELGVASKNAQPSEWHDTADLVVYLGCPRSLKNASAVLFGIEMSKDVRDKMKGKPWNTMTPEFQQEVMAYALKDSELCLRIWKEHSAKWPEWERQLSLHTRAMCWRGLPVDAEGVREDVRLLELQLWQCRSKIPWASDEDAAVLSPKAMAAECRKYGVEPPRSMAKDSEEFDAWMEQYGEKLPFATAMSQYRRINTLLQKFRALERRTKPDGWMPFALKYFGAHTGRWSGDSGVNVQNMGRDPVFFDECGIVGDPEKIEEFKAKIKKGEPVPVPFVDMRKRIKAPEGKKFVVCDLSNIEPRCMAVLGGDTATLETLRTGADIYEAHARATMRYTDPRPLKEVDGELRRLSKARCLSGGAPVLTEEGYMTIKELRKNPGLRLWDGVEWIHYDEIQLTGLRQVSDYLGELLTADHPVFTSRGAVAVGQIFKGPARECSETLLRRNPPGGDWADIWALARFVVESLKKEWGVVCKRCLRRLRQKAKSELRQLKARLVHALRRLRGEKSEGDAGHAGVGARAGRAGLNPKCPMGRNDEEVL